MKNLSIEVDRQSGRITIWNDGRGIPIKIHKQHRIYVPELIFGHMLTSSNFDVCCRIENIQSQLLL